MRDRKSDKTQIRNTFPLIVATFLLFGVNGTGMSAMSEYVIDLGGNAMIAGLQGGAFILAAVLLRFITGPLADRLGSKPMLLLGGIAFLAPGAILPFCKSLSLVIALRIVQALGLASFHPNIPHYLTEEYSETESSRLIGYARFAGTGALIATPILLFPLIDSFGYKSFFAALSCMSLVALLCIFLMPEHHHTSKQSIAKKADRRISLEEIHRFLPYFVLPFILALGYSIILMFGPLYLKQYAEESNGGLIVALASAGGLAGNLLVSGLREKRGLAQIKNTTILCLAFGLCLISMAPVRVSAAYIGALIGGFGYSGGTTMLIAELGTQAKKRLPGTFFSIQQSCLDLGLSAGGFLVGVLVQAGISLSSIFALFGLLLATALAVWVSYAKH